jgi:hypothetical protein
VDVRRGLTNHHRRRGPDGDEADAATGRRSGVAVSFARLAGCCRFAIFAMVARLWNVADGEVATAETWTSRPGSDIPSHSAVAGYAATAARTVGSGLRAPRRWGVASPGGVAAFTRP